MNAHTNFEAMRAFDSVLSQAYTLARTTPAFEDALRMQMFAPPTVVMKESRCGDPRVIHANKRREDVLEFIACNNGCGAAEVFDFLQTKYPGTKAGSVQSDLRMLRDRGQITTGLMTKGAATYFSTGIPEAEGA